MGVPQPAMLYPVPHPPPAGTTESILREAWRVEGFATVNPMDYLTVDGITKVMDAKVDLRNTLHRPTTSIYRPEELPLLSRYRSFVAANALGLLVQELDHQLTWLRARAEDLMKTEVSLRKDIPRGWKDFARSRTQPKRDRVVKAPRKARTEAEKSGSDKAVRPSRRAPAQTPPPQLRRPSRKRRPLIWRPSRSPSRSWIRSPSLRWRRLDIRILGIRRLVIRRRRPPRRWMCRPAFRSRLGIQSRGTSLGWIRRPGRAPQRRWGRGAYRRVPRVLCSKRLVPTWMPRWMLWIGTCGWISRPVRSQGRAGYAEGEFVHHHCIVVASSLRVSSSG